MNNLLTTYAVYAGVQNDILTLKITQGVVLYTKYKT